jgi:hypothetical protein
MMRRAAFFALSFLAVLWALTGPVTACSSSHTGADWACLYVEHLNTGLCQQNPLPQELPVPVPTDLQVVPDEVPEVAPLLEGVIQLIPDVKPEVPSVASIVNNPTGVVPGGTPVPGNPTSLVPGAPSPPSVPTVPKAPYVPTGMPGTPI